jgi:thymidylate kinase
MHSESLNSIQSVVQELNSKTQFHNKSHVSGLVQELCKLMELEGITYCHWKSNNALDRSASGINDLDLLVSRADTNRFNRILIDLGFKQCQAPREKQIPGVLNFFGFDIEADKLIHVHAHYQLIMGHDMTKNYRLPIERPYLESAIQTDLFKIPAPEFEFIVFVIRMVLKHSTWDSILSRQGRLKITEREELAYLQSRIELDRVYSILNQYLPYINHQLFDRCMQTLQPACSTWIRIKTGQQLQVVLQSYAHRPLLIDILLKLWRRADLAIRRRVFRITSKYHFESGGAMIAIVGGDGAGKSTAVDALHTWLAKDFNIIKVHMGKPDWSWLTISVRGILKIGNMLGLYPWEPFNETYPQKSLVSPGYPWLLREVCRARDRYWTYRRAQRFAVNGGLVILDRYPLPQIQLMDGPQTERFISQLMERPQSEQFLSPHQASRLAKGLVKLEESYYNQFVVPELLIVLRVDPEIAVERKTDEESTSVRERSTEIWELNWEQSDAHVIDASKSKSDVLAEIKALIWSDL